MKSEFLEPVILSNIVPVQKKQDPTDKTNYRSISTLSLLTKVFEKVIYEQLYEYFNYFLNDPLRGFCKAHSTQHVLSALI